MTSKVSTTHLTTILQDARSRTMELVAGLDEKQLMGPHIATVNPLRWEIGHVAYFYEFFILRQMYGHESLIGAKADKLYDSITVTHDTRWGLPLLSTSETLSYMRNVLDKLCEHLEQNNEDSMASEQDSFMYQFGVFHEDMHTEAFTCARQILAYPTPSFAIAQDMTAERSAGPLPGYVDIPGGVFQLGGDPKAAFLFDNEKLAHDVNVKPFSIAKAPVTNEEFSLFVDDGGYQDKRFWDEQAWAFMLGNNQKHPGYWVEQDGRNWAMRRFDQVIPLPLHEPVSHVTWHEANAYCSWAGLRLPTEAEWEVAALGEIAKDGTLARTKRKNPWGDAAPDAKLANLDGRSLGCIDVAALPAGDSAFGCRQMHGNIWEWTADVFNPYPGFNPDAYKEYSQMLFGTTRVLRGGAWTTRSRMLHGTYRNFFEPHLWNVFSGFRSCQSGKPIS
jgi:iron(II)-dependent oxidoreductase